MHNGDHIKSEHGSVHLLTENLAMKRPQTQPNVLHQWEVRE